MCVSEPFHQKTGFLLDPFLNAFLPHPKVSERGEGKSAKLLPPLPIAEYNAWKREENRKEGWGQTQFAKFLT